MATALGPPGSTLASKKNRRKGSGRVGASNTNGLGCPSTHRGTPIEPINLEEMYQSLISPGRHLPLFASTFSHMQDPRGIVNNANFCFMNAILQALIFTPSFAQLAVSAASESEWCPTLSTLGKWMLSYWSRGPTQTIVPPRLPFAARSRPTHSAGAVPSRKPALDGLAQEDAHEFLHVMLEVIQSELRGLEMHYAASGCTPLRSGSPSISSSVDTKGWTFVNGRERHSVREQVEEHRALLFDAIFGGTLQSHLKGKSKLKDHASVVVERFFSLPVDVGFSADCSIEDALERTLQTERVHDGTRDKDLLKTLRLQRLPTVLMLQLRRWAITAEGELVKLDNTVRLGRKLVLPKSTCADTKLSNRERTYEMVAFVAHRGRAAERGHYVTYVMNTAANTRDAHGENHTDKEFVTLCNDVRISTANMRDALDRETVYFLVYQQKK